MRRLKYLNFPNRGDGSCDERFDAPLIGRDQRHNWFEGVTERISCVLSRSERESLGFEIRVFDAQVDIETVHLTIFRKSIDEFLEQPAFLGVFQAFAT